MKMAREYEATFKKNKDKKYSRRVESQLYQV